MVHDTARKPAAPAACEQLCGPRVGDRRVRIARQPRGTGRKLIAILRRTLSR